MDATVIGLYGEELSITLGGINERMYPTMMKAFHAASEDYSEYGVSIHPECEE